MVNDKALEFNSKVIKIERLIENLKSIGINTSKYENQVKDIKSELIKLDVTSNKYFGIENDYITAISKLNKLEAHLNEYMVYFKAYSFTMHVNEDIENIEENKLSFYIEELIKLLKGIKASGTLIYDKEKEIIESLYKVAYYLLLEENEHLTEHKLFNYVSGSEVDLYYLDRILLNDIQSISNKEALKKINGEIHLINLKGSEAHYITEDILRKVIYAKYGDDLRDKTTEELNKIANEIKDNLTQIKHKTKAIENEMSRIEIIKESIKEFKIDLAKQIASISLNFGLLTFTLGVVPFIFSKYPSPRTYKYTYDLDGNVIEEVDEGYQAELDDYYKGKVTVREPYTLKKGEYKYDYKEYTFAEDEFEAVLNALKNGKELDYEEKSGKYTALEAASAPEETVTTIEVRKQDKDDTISVLERDTGSSIAISVFTGLLITGIIYIPFVTVDEFKFALCEKIPDLKDLIEDFIESKDVKRLKEKKLDVALMNAELMKLVQNDEKLRERFMRIYKANESLFVENKEIFEKLINEVKEGGQTLALK